MLDVILLSLVICILSEIRSLLERDDVSHKVGDIGFPQLIDGLISRASRLK